MESFLCPAVGTCVTCVTGYTYAIICERHLNVHLMSISLVGFWRRRRGLFQSDVPWITGRPVDDVCTAAATTGDRERRKQQLVNQNDSSGDHHLTMTQ